jgi:predicted NBD/HSP70 family sugar kinase
MDHVAIDLGGRESQICRRGSDGKIIEERRCRTNKLDDYLGTLSKSRIIVETCAESFKVADAARALGHEVVVRN